ncbi:MAG: 2-(1,2-epoxy-1,2-dihydrophenyl)acetyl-CoA isomerase PaaG [Saprospiraceae bacterium]|nr:2-(1,2-epoxy-1,2-dihydrophenyl)acetyl-CoA isomerase PaaG [Saprospiraceae bacterium]MDW8483796.1 enoyl-CoA hydratase-related protein [Saprospiraceae bacterium]
MFEHILWHVEEGVACITLNRPSVFNAMHHSMRQELLAALDLCRNEDAIRAVYLTGAGRAFCAGQDLQEVVDPNGPALHDILSSGYNPIVRAIRNLEKPVVCAVNGAAAGAGANLALACDITVAAASAFFTQAFSKIGLIPDSGGTWTLPRLVGLQRAAALMMLSDKISAEEAAAMGMIWKVYPDDSFAAESMRLAQTLAQLPTRALGLTKRALNRTFSNDFNAQLALEDDLQVQAGQTQDYREGVSAFLEKRKPVFKGE